MEICVRGRHASYFCFAPRGWQRPKGFEELKVCVKNDNEWVAVGARQLEKKGLGRRKGKDEWNRKNAGMRWKVFGICLWTSETKGRKNIREDVERVRGRCPSLGFPFRDANDNLMERVCLLLLMDELCRGNKKGEMGQSGRWSYEHVECRHCLRAPLCDSFYKIFYRW